MKKFFPSLEHISQEVIATAIAVIGVAWLVSRVPALKALVKSYDS
ncbi:hypothetical protein [Herbaspirillum robiniae]|nr:hypothetical protein [Herbaspirillum robiniae]